MSGLDHVFERTKDFGLSYPKHRAAGPVDGHRHPRGPPDRPARRLRHDRQRRRAACRAGSSARSSTTTARVVLADSPRTRPKGTQVISAAGGLHHHRHPGRQHRHEGQPVLGQVGDLRQAGRAGRPPTRPARRATTATWHAYGYLAPPADKKAPALAVGVWMGNSNNDPNDGKLSLDTSAPLWSAILTEVSQGHPRSPSSSRRRMRSRPRRSTRSPASSPARSRRRRSRRSSCPGTVPTETRDVPESPSTVDAASGLLWREGCAGPKVTARLLQPVRGREQLPELAEGERGVGRASGPRVGRPRRPEGDADRLLLQRRLRPVRADLGCAVRSHGPSCPLYTRRRSTAIRSPTPDPGRPAADLRSRCPTDPGGGGRSDDAPTDEDARSRLTGRGRRGPRRPVRARRSSPRRRLRRADRAASTSPAGGRRPSTGPRRAARRCPSRG